MHGVRCRTDSTDEVKVDVECDKRYWQKSEEQLQDAGDRVNVTTLVRKRSCSIAVCEWAATTQNAPN